MKVILIASAFLFSGISFAQEECKFEVTDSSSTHPLQVQFSCEPQEFSFLIYDRWGQEVYRTENPDFMWNHKDKDGKIVENGTYLYVISCILNGEEVKKTGHYTIIP